MGWVLCQRRRSVGISCWLVAWKRKEGARPLAEVWHASGMVWFGLVWFGLGWKRLGGGKRVKIKERKKRKEIRECYSVD